MEETGVERAVSLLETSEDKLRAIEDLTLLLASTSASDGTSGYHFQHILSLLNKPEFAHEDVQSAGFKVLGMFAERIPAHLLLEDYHDVLMVILAGNNENAISLVIQQLSRLAKSNPMAYSKYADILNALVMRLSKGNDERLYSLLKTITIGCDAYPLRGCDLFKDDVLQSADSSISMRAIQYLVEISAGKNEKIFGEIVESGHFDPMIAQLNTSTDLLVLLNLFELSSDLAFTAHGVHFLSDLGVIDSAVRQLETASNSLMMPSLLKFLASAYAESPTLVDRRIKFVDDVAAKVVDGSDPVVRAVAMETFGFIAQSDEAKVIIHVRHNESAKQCLAVIGRHATQPPADLQEKCLLSLSRAFLCTGDTAVVERVVSDWFQCVPEFDRLFMKSLQHSQTEIRIATHTLIASLISYRWALDFFHQQSGFIEFLLNAGLENDSKARKSKQNLLQEFIRNAEMFEMVFGSELLERFRNSLKAPEREPIPHDPVTLEI